MQAGAVFLNRGRVLVPAGMNEAWRIFCRPGTNLIEFYECRGTNFMASRLEIKVYKVLKEALARSRYRHYKSVMGAGANCKKCDKQMTFIVRVMLRHYLKVSAEIFLRSTNLIFSF
jgi:bacterioferritin-associated ferredoxin